MSEIGRVTGSGACRVPFGVIAPPLPVHCSPTRGSLLPILRVRLAIKGRNSTPSPDMVRGMRLRLRSGETRAPAGIPVAMPTFRELSGSDPPISHEGKLLYSGAWSDSSLC
jgi:hypothetical protein